MTDEERTQRDAAQMAARNRRLCARLRVLAAMVNIKREGRKA